MAFFVNFELLFKIMHIYTNWKQASNAKNSARKKQQSECKTRLNETMAQNDR